jgi:uncharacterized protein
MPVNLDAVTAIDSHVHVEADGHGHHSLDDELLAASAAYFKAGANRTPALPEIAAYYRERNLAAVVFTVDAHTATGHPAVSSAQLIAEAQDYDDVLIPFASVDPLADGAAKQLRDLAAAGAKGLKLHPSLQAFVPSDRAYYPIYETAAELGLPVVFHTGQTGIGAGLPGGRGIKLRYSDPMLIDDVAADHPGLTIVLAHPSVPWQDAAISIATHKANVFIDLSGWSQRYFPPQLVRAAGGLLRHKVLFGSDYPLITPDRWLADFETLDIRPEARPLILKQNAARVLGLIQGEG